MTRFPILFLAIACLCISGNTAQAFPFPAGATGGHLAGSNPDSATAVPAGSLGNMLAGFYAGFTENRGQIADAEGRPRPEILYTADIGSARLFFTRGGVSTVFSRVSTKGSVSEATARRTPSLQEPGTEDERMLELFRLDMRLVGANPFAEVRGIDELPGSTNYYLAHCPSGITRVPRNARLLYRNVYEGIDLVYHSAGGGRMKYEFVVRPGADPSQIRMHYDDGVVTLGTDGRLRIDCSIGVIEENAPDVYQGGRILAGCSFDVHGQDVGFSIDAYDRNTTLVIDPWGTYLPSNGSVPANPWCINTTPGGDIIADGYADGSFPVSGGYHCVFGGGNIDAFTALYSSGGALLWSTFHGGDGDESCYNAGMDASGNIYVAGNTTSTNLPTFSAYQPTYGGNRDAYLLKMSGSGTLTWVTYIGGAGSENLSTVIVDGSGNVLAAGENSGGQFPTLNAYDSTFNGNSDLVAVKFTSTGSMLWSTYYGGPNTEERGIISLAANDSIIIKARNSGGGFEPMINSYDPTQNGGWDHVIMKCAPDGVPVWSTYFGGSSDDGTGGPPTDEIGGVFYFAGMTTSTDYPLINANQAFLKGSNDPCMMQFNGQGTPLWSTYFGGSGTEESGVGVSGANGGVLLGGTTLSADFPILNAFLPSPGPSFLKLGYIAKFSSSYALEFSSYLYGSPKFQNYNTQVNRFAASSTGDIIVAGQTADDLNGTIGLFPPIPAAGFRAFLLCMNGNGSIPVELSSFDARIAGGRVHLAWTTESETGNAGFVVQRTLAPSSDAWETCAFIAGMGTTTARQEYACTDVPPRGLAPDQGLYYRLKQIDTDGRVHYSGIVEAVLGRVPEGFAILDVHPQPAHGDVTVRLSGSGGEVTLRVVDMLGRTVCEQRAAGMSALRLDLESSPAGMYTLVAERDGARAIRCIVLR